MKAPATLRSFCRREADAVDERIPMRPTFNQRSRGLILSMVLIALGITGSVAAWAGEFDQTSEPEIGQDRTGQPARLAQLRDRQYWERKWQLQMERDKAETYLERKAREERERRAAVIANDKAVPMLRVEAPEKVSLSAGRLNVTGLVADEVSPPRLDVDGNRQPLFDRLPSDPYLAKYTYRFDLDLPVDAVGNKTIRIEACDANGNCLAESVVVEIVAGPVIVAAEPPGEAHIAELEAEIQRLGEHRIPVGDGALPAAELCASPTSSGSGGTWSNVGACVTYLEAVERLRSARDARARFLAGGGTREPTAEDKALLARLEAAEAEGRAAEQRARHAEEKARDLAAAQEQANQSAEPAPVDQPNIAARNHALIVGNNDYGQLPSLRSAVGDAKAMAEVLTSRYAFDPDDVTLLLNADRRAILGGLEDLQGRLGPDDRLLIYYAGHGEIDPVTEEGFWQPVDAEPGRQFTWIANDDVRRYLRGMPAKHVLVVADSCFSGSLTRSAANYASVPRDRFFTEIDENISRKAISSGGTKPVMDSGSKGHSVFAYYLLKALRENDQPYLASFELFGRLARAVTNNSSQKPEFGTVQEAGDEGAGDFTFILRQ
jgi:uncharacterized caspase-like protein